MRRLEVILGVAAAFVAMAVSAPADNSNWLLQCEFTLLFPPPFPSAFGTQAWALDGVDGQDAPTPTVGVPEYYVISSWTSDPAPIGMYQDIRAPLAPGQVKVWNLRTPGSGGGLNIWNPVDQDILPTTPVRVSILTSGGETSYEWDPSVNGTAQSPGLHLDVPPDASVRITAGPQVPEPAGLLALCAGLVGLGARRKLR